MELSHQLRLDLLASLVHVPLEGGNDPFLHLDEVLLQVRIHTLSLLPCGSPERSYALVAAAVGGISTPRNKRAAVHQSRATGRTAASATAGNPAGSRAETRSKTAFTSEMVM